MLRRKNNMSPIEIKDGSDDRKYFTIVPNFILNHSSANDQSLYLQMKRIAGDGGTCEAGYRYFTKQLHIGFKAYQKSIEYLLEHNWIEFVGQKRVMTSGGRQSLNIYKVNNIWSTNNQYYGGGAKSNHLDGRGGAENKKRVVPKITQGGAESEHKNNCEEELKEDETEKCKKNKKTPREQMEKGLKQFLEKKQ